MYVTTGFYMYKKSGYGSALNLNPVCDMRIRVCLDLCKALCCWTFCAQSALSETGPIERGSSSDDDLKVRGVFESNLPNTEKKHALKMSLHPHFGDLHRHNHLRVPVGFRYGMSENWELGAEVETYLDHGLGDGAGESGVSGYAFSSKYHSNFFPNSRWEEVIGFDFFHPASTPPVDLTDGLVHFRPYYNFARNVSYDSGSRIFWGVGLDLVSDSGVVGRLKDNAIGDNANVFTAGRIWEGERLTYTFESTYATSRLIGSNRRDLVILRPGIIWRVPSRYTFNSNGDWMLGVGLKLSNGSDGVDYGVSLKVKIDLDMKDRKKRRGK